MKLNKNKSIGRVLFIVEGSRTEFSILRRIFCNILGYSYIEKRRNRPTYFVSIQDRFSQIAVVNTRESNIRDISENEKYLDDVFDVLREQYKFPIDQSAIYYLFDRDPKSNTDPALIEKYILSLANPYDNNDYKAGQLLLSYPSIESYLVSNFRDAANFLRFSLGTDAKKYIGQNTDIQCRKIHRCAAVQLHQGADGFIKGVQFLFVLSSVGVLGQLEVLLHKGIMDGLQLGMNGGSILDLSDCPHTVFVLLQLSAERGGGLV